MGQDGEDTDGEKDGCRIINEQAVCHLYGSWFVLSHVKPFGVGSSQIVSFITCILEKETGNIVLETMVVDSLADLLANSLPGMKKWPGIHWMKMEDKMKLMELWT